MRKHTVLILVISALALSILYLAFGPIPGGQPTAPIPIKIAQVPTVLPKPTATPEPKPTARPSRVEIRKRKREARRKEQEEAKKMAKQKEIQEEAKGRAVDYTVSKTEDSSIAGLTRYTVRILVPQSIRAVDVRPTAEKIIADLITKDQEIDELGLFLYNSEPAEGIYTVAAVDWAPNGEWGTATSEIAESNDRSSYNIKVQAATNQP